MRQWMILAPLCLLLAACGGNSGQSSFATGSSSSGSSTSSSTSSSSGSSTSSSSSSSGSSSGGSSGSGAAFWIPYQATPVTGTSGVKAGLFVIPSQSPTTAPAFVSTNAQTLFLGAAFTTTVNASHIITLFSPALYLYAAADSSNNIHVYELDLAVGTQPVPTQIGTLSEALPAGAALNTVICDSNFAFTNFLQPNTLFVVLHIAGPAGCGTAGDVWMVVHASDSATTAPVSVPIATTQFIPLYSQPGLLTGLVLRDPNTNNLFLYPDDTFSPPTTAIAGGGVSAMSTVYNNTVNPNEAFIGTDLFLAVTINSVNYLYNLPNGATTATMVYTATGTLSTAGVADDTNLYFSDVVANTSTTQTIWQTPLSGGTPMLLYTYSVPTTGVPYQLIGSDDSSLVLLTNSTNASTSATTGMLATLPVGTASTGTTPLGTALNGAATAFVLPATPGTRASDLVIVDAVNTAAGASYVYSSEVLTPGNVLKQSQLPNSYFLRDGRGALSGSVLQLTGINPAVAGLGGGALNAVSLATLAVTPLKGSSGTTYAVPSGFDPAVGQLSNTVGTGEEVPHSPTTGVTAGLAYDLSNSLIVPISISNTNVTPL
jgi:hypothetical protein